MANIDFASAVNAYNKVGGLKIDQAINLQDSEDSKNVFSSLVDNLLTSNVDKVKRAEQTSQSVINGESSIEDLAIAIADAEISLKAMVAIRDKIVSAYQDIIRMPI